MNAETKIERADNVHTRLNEARHIFHSTELKKTGWNNFAEYKYFELGDFLIPALAIFNEVGLSGLVSFTADVATLCIFNVDNPSDCLTITSPMGSAKLKACHEVQNIGAVETYQRRYLWTTALEIVEHDALEATTGQKGKEPEAEAQETGPKITNEQVVRIQSLLKATAISAVQFNQIMGCKSVPDLSASKFVEAVDRLETTLAKKAKEQTDAKAKEPA